MNHPHTRAGAPRRLAAALAAMLCLYGQAHAASITDDFSTANPEWVKVDPFGPLGAPSSYELRDGKYAVTTKPSPMPALGPVVATSARMVSWADFNVAVEISGWSAGPQANTYAGMVARQKINANGTSNGYGMLLAPSSTAGGTATVGIYLLVNGEAIFKLNGEAIPDLDPARNYVLEFSGRGPTLQGILRMKGEATPISTLRARDLTYASGNISLVAVHREPVDGLPGNSGVGVLFDNFAGQDFAPTLPPNLAGQTPAATPTLVDDFEDGNDAGWERLNPLASSGVHNTFEASGGAYRLGAPGNPAPAYNTAVAGALRDVEWGDFQVSVEVRGWTADSESNTTVMIAARHQSGPDGADTFYALRLRPAQLPSNTAPIPPVLGIDRWVNGNNRPTTGGEFFSSVPPAAGSLDPAKTYRLLFAGRGELLRGWLHEVGSPEKLLAYVEARDSQLREGKVGLLVLDSLGRVNRGNRPAAATFDNFRASGSKLMADDFSGPLSDAYKQFHPFAAFGVRGSITTADGVLTISHPPSPAPQIAPATSSISRDETHYSEFWMEVEFSGWSDAADANPVVALIGHHSLNADGTSNGHAMVVKPSASPQFEKLSFVTHPSISFERLVRGAPIGSLGIAEIPKLDPAKWYRAVFTMRQGPPPGSRMEGWIYERGNPKPLAHALATVQRPSIHSGGAALGVLDLSGFLGTANTGFSLKFDNFQVNGVEVAQVGNPSLAITPSVTLEWPAATAGWILEGAPSASGPWTKSPETPGVVGDINEVSIRASSSQHYFRLRKP